MPKLPIKEMLRDLDFEDLDFTVEHERISPNFTRTHMGTDLAILIIIIVFLLAWTMLLLLLSSMGILSFEQTWNTIPWLAVTMIVIWIRSHIKRKNNKQDV